ncbi:alanine dehydrogenase [Nigerium massiliense]|uniref:alanine dehydrogenase n=1 Tax=Nigerium massiliense TaxID=1522317 RepID=UPI00058FA3E4|nr:alanine dehydrogenase [Nigerium massiliense]
MRISVPAEVKNNESRVAMTPISVHELVRHGHEVYIQAGAGEGSSIPDAEYEEQGATIVPDAAAAWEAGELVCKVKEPIAEEYPFLREDQALFTYLHLAADRPLTEALIEAKTPAIAYETVRRADGQLPLLYPMSEVAGRLAPVVGAYYLLKPQGGPGILLGGVGGVKNAKVVVIGGGTAGQNAAQVANGMGADVTVLDTDLDKLRTTFWRYGNAVRQIASSSLAIRTELKDADLVIGTVLIPGARAPKLVTNEMVASMNPGSVLVDVAIDQGGCFEDSHATTHADPVFTVHQSTFYCVANMPGAVANTSTYALTNATLPYTVALADKGWRQACADDPALAQGVNTAAGTIVHPGVAEAFDDLPSTSLDEVLA